MIKELKKELSKLSGVDFFNPKFRDIFKKYFPNESVETEVNGNEEDRLKEVLGDEEIKTEETVETEENEDKEEETSTEVEEKDSSESEENLDTEEVSETENETEPETEVNDNEEDPSVDEETEEISDSKTLDEKKDKPTETVDTSRELLEMKVELALVKAGVRDDRLDSAKKLFMADIHSIEDLDNLKDMVLQYPEWLKQTKQKVQPFGMPLGDTSNGLTEEEKRLKAMGIDPKS